MQDETIIQEKPQKKTRTSFLSGRGILVVLSAKSLGKTYILDRDSLTIGRDPSCDICLQDTGISKFHSRITKAEKNQFILEDLDSTNGTFLNNKRITKPQPIFYSDRIVLGTTIFRFFQEETLEKK